ncbi:hypothetical protein DFH07DRAFT_969859 [Mycena maculata]|uniref:Uncharacterized protein n=1 Tax=Mycena maculata TaxID=230809 RepID=A0AAD7MR81_9AGAR|nr:hypothetical protein DFH07DRAFT_969859 [Mycena maculata]
MHPTHILCIILGAASTLAAPLAKRDGLERQARQDLSSHTETGIIDEALPGPANADIVLPPVAEVLAIMATVTSIQLSSPSTTTLSATDVIHLGPGLVAPTPTIDHIEQISPTMSSASGRADYEPPTVAHKFLFVSIVVLSMMALILTIYAFSYHRHQLRMNALKRATPHMFPAEKEKEKGRSSVVDITRNFPGSKFSVTSSDYPVSTRFSESTNESQSSFASVDLSEGDSDGSERGLMNPGHFFALRAASMASSHCRHSRGGSAPVFGIPRYDVRREQSRRSRSVSRPREEEW